MDHITIALPAEEKGTQRALLLERLVEAINTQNVPHRVALDALLSAYGSIVLSDTKHMASALVCCHQLMGEILARVTEVSPAASVSVVATPTSTAH